MFRLEEGVWAGGQGCPILDHRFLNFLFVFPPASQDLHKNILIALLFSPKSSGSGRGEVGAADAGFEPSREEAEERGRRQPRSVLTPTPGPHLIAGSPCTGDQDLTLSLKHLENPPHQDRAPSLLPDSLKVLLHSPHL